MNEQIDLLGRAEYVKAIKDILEKSVNINKNTTLCLDGEWGCGKTFIIKLLEHELKDWIIFKYDAWEQDYYQEPLEAILTIIINKLNQINEKKNHIKSISSKLLKDFGKMFKDILDAVVSSKIGIKPFKLSSKVKKYFDSCNDAGIDTSFDKNEPLSDAKAAVRLLLKELSNKSKVLFIVDEIDRCDDEYALKVLERVHHISNSGGNLQTIISVDCTKLEFFIEKKYQQSKTNISQAYLKKFFDIKLFVNCGNINDKFKERFTEYENSFANVYKFLDSDFTDFEKDLFDSINIRIVNKIFEKANLIHKSLAPENKKMDCSIKCFELLICAASLNFSTGKILFGLFQYPFNPTVDVDSPFKLNLLTDNLHKNYSIITNAYPGAFITIKDLWSYLWYQIVNNNYSNTPNKLNYTANSCLSQKQIDEDIDFLNNFTQVALFKFR